MNTVAAPVRLVTAALLALSSFCMAQPAGRDQAQTLVQVLRFEAPPSAEAGKAIRAPLSLRVPKAAQRHRTPRLELSSNGVVVARAALALPRALTQWQPETAEELTAALRVPPWIRPGTYKLRLAGEQLRFADAADQPVTRSVKISSKSPSPTVVEVASQGGAPTLFINGQPQAGLLIAPLPAGAEAGQRWSAVGLHLYRVACTADYDLYGDAPDVWLAPDQFHYSALDRQLVDLLNADPDGFVLLRVFLCSPEWWDREHLRDAVLFGHGRHAFPLAPPGRKNTYPSFASARWRQDTTEALTRLIRHVEGAPYADRVIGYQLASGVGGSWEYWGSRQQVWMDYAPVNRTSFRGWLRARYGTLPDLREAWGNLKLDWGAPRLPEEKLPSIPADAKFTWSDVRVPAPKLRETAPTFALQDPTATQALADYTLYQSDLVADTLLAFAHAARQAAGGRKLVGAAYGHLLEVCRYPLGVQNSGQLAITRVLQSEDLSFLSGPPCRTDARLGIGYAGPASAVASVQSRTKLWLMESDLPTTVRPPEKRDSAEQIGLMYRDLAGAIAGGYALTWLDRTDGYRNAAVRDELQRMREIAAQSLSWDRLPVAEIAVVVDDVSLAYLKPGNSLAKNLLADQMILVSHIGAPFDVWTLADVAAGRAPAYRLYLFLDAFWVDAVRRSGLVRQVRHGGATAVWFCAPGALSPEGVSGRSALALTGLALTYEDKSVPLRVVVADPGHEYMRDVQYAMEYGTTEAVGPVFHCFDREAETVGKIKGLGLVGFCMRKFPTWTTVFSAAPDLPAVVLRNIARSAGVHLYVESGDQVMANEGFLALHTATGGKRRVRLPQARTVFDLRHGRLVAENVTEFEVSLPARDTALFRLQKPGKF